jgi:hypothetical protein
MKSSRSHYSDGDIQMPNITAANVSQHQPGNSQESVPHDYPGSPAAPCLMVRSSILLNVSWQCHRKMIDRLLQLRQLLVRPILLSRIDRRLWCIVIIRAVVARPTGAVSTCEPTPKDSRHDCSTLYDAIDNSDAPASPRGALSDSKEQGCPEG